jgi:hypothetical protein
MSLFRNGAATLRDREANLGWCWGDGRPSLSEQIEQYYVAQAKEREVDDSYAELMKQRQTEACYEVEACYAGFAVLTEVQAYCIVLDAQREVEEYLADELAWSTTMSCIDERSLVVSGQLLVA